MTNKAYIVANEQQEREVLEKLEREGYLWRGTDMRPTEKHRLIDEPITIFAREDKRLGFDYGVNEVYLADYRIDYDGRKEEQMSNKYVVSQEFMNELEEWKDTLASNDYGYKTFVGLRYLYNLPPIVADWWLNKKVPDKENNNRLSVIIRWVNGENVFEVEKPKKWVVRSKESQGSVDGKPLYGWFVDEYTVELEATMPPYVDRFNTREEAESWANSHQEVIEVEG